ncbi:MAG: heavy-metal-associated domain-containing protein, partial [Candidatus Brocadiales bacterium]|nr:heavy-metal-associated domain-containing protein [Candidatus Bathyanammoxibius sp.]
MFGRVGRLNAWQRRAANFCQAALQKASFIKQRIILLILWRIGERIQVTDSLSAQTKRLHFMSSAPVIGKNMKTIILPVQGMHCATCAGTIEDALKKLPGIKEVMVNFATENMSLKYDAKVLSLDAVRKAVKGLGYKLADLEAQPPGKEVRLHDHHAMFKE